MIEEKEGSLSLIPTSPRGAPATQNQHNKRKARSLIVPHIALEDTILAYEVQNVREFGPQMQPRSVETYLSGRMEMFTAQLDATTGSSGSAPSRA